MTLNGSKTYQWLQVQFGVANHLALIACFISYEKWTIRKKVNIKDPSTCVESHNGACIFGLSLTIGLATYKLNHLGVRLRKGTHMTSFVPAENRGV